MLQWKIKEKCCRKGGLQKNFDLVYANIVEESKRLLIYYAIKLGLAKPQQGIFYIRN